MRGEAKVTLPTLPGPAWTGGQADLHQPTVAGSRPATAHGAPQHRAGTGATR